MPVEHLDQPDWKEHILVRLMRRWAAARDLGENSTVSVVILANHLGELAMVAVALDSMLQLTESCLGRRLETECCCSQAVSGDERAVLVMIRSHAGPSLVNIPHGLPGALAWAATSLGRLLGTRLPAAEPASSRQCPFKSEAYDRCARRARVPPPTPH